MCSGVDSGDCDLNFHAAGGSPIVFEAIHRNRTARFNAPLKMK
jgi:hypothetical protein